MKQIIAILLALTILILSGCQNAGPAGEFIDPKTNTTPTHQTDSVNESFNPVFEDPESDLANTESVSQAEDDSTIESIPAATPGSSENESGNEQGNKQPESQKETKPTQTDPTEPKTPALAPTEPKETTPPATQPPETEPPCYGASCY